jgi:hypothetical protein
MGRPADGLRACVFLPASSLVLALLLGACAPGPGAPPTPRTAGGGASRVSGVPGASGTPVDGATTLPAGASPVTASIATPTPTPTPAPTPTATPPPVAATVNGVWVPANQAERATRPAIAVMVDDHPDARPQSGLSDADLIYQAPAEGGIPRYMLVYQASDAPAIGPVRSSRRYFAGWASEWRPLYAHVGGAPNALAFLHQANASLLWDADEYSWPSYLWRITTRAAPHNVYTSSKRLRELAARLGDTGRVDSPAWSFKDDASLVDRPEGGAVVVPYPWNEVSYRYDRRTNRYLRFVSGGKPQIDAATNRQVAPADVVVLFMSVGPLVNAPGQLNNQAKGRLELGYVGSGDALVFRDGVELRARWSKASDADPTRLTLAAGPQAGDPVALVRGQIAMQVVPIGTPITFTPGAHPEPRVHPR